MKTKIFEMFNVLFHQGQENGTIKCSNPLSFKELLDAANNALNEQDEDAIITVDYYGIASLDSKKEILKKQEEARIFRQKELEEFEKRKLIRENIAKQEQEKKLAWVQTLPRYNGIAKYTQTFGGEQTMYGTFAEVYKVVSYFEIETGERILDERLNGLEFKEFK